MNDKARHNTYEECRTAQARKDGEYAKTTKVIVAHGRRWPAGTRVKIVVSSVCAFGKQENRYFERMYIVSMHDDPNYNSITYAKESNLEDAPSIGAVDSGFRERVTCFSYEEGKTIPDLWQTEIDTKTVIEALEPYGLPHVNYRMGIRLLTRGREIVGVNVSAYIYYRHDDYHTWEFVKAPLRGRDLTGGENDSEPLSKKFCEEVAKVIKRPCH